MSLTLQRSYWQPEVNTKCKFNNNQYDAFMEDDIIIGNLYINKEDFVEMVMYVMVNTDLEINDVRYDLKDRISKLKIVNGYNKPLKRFSEKIEIKFKELNLDILKKAIKFKIDEAKAMSGIDDDHDNVYYYNKVNHCVELYEDYKLLFDFEVFQELYKEVNV